MPEAAILYPVLALVAWTFVMWAWMYATRIPAIQRADIDMEELSRTGGSLDMPPEVARVADNYNHLHEQPTIFYATALALAIAGHGDGLNLWMAWSYTGLRVAHSIVQSTSNIVMIRFLIFALATVALVVMAVNGVIQLL